MKQCHYCVNHQITTAQGPFQDPVPGGTWESFDFSFVHDGSSTVVLSLNSDGTGDWLVDDIIDLTVTHPDGSTANFNHNFWSNPNCTFSGKLCPTDVSALFVFGSNKVHIEFKDGPGCQAIYGSGNSAQSTSIWLACP